MKNFGLKTMLMLSWVLPTVVSILSNVLPASFSRTILMTGMFALGYAHAVVVVSYSLIVAFLFKGKKKRTEQVKCSTTTCRECRNKFPGSALAIVTDIYTACWFPLMIAFYFSGKPLFKPNGATHMWLRTLALSNSPWTFSFTLREFHNGYVEIFRKCMGRLVWITYPKEAVVSGTFKLTSTLF